MRKFSKGSRLLSALLVLAMVLSIVPVTAFAAVGDLSNVSTGLTGNIDTSDTISLPIKILDYEADGMLFEYAEAYAGVSGIEAAKTAGDFGATWYEDYTTRTSVGGSINTGNYWSDVTLALKTGNYANYTRATWAGNTTANWTGNRAGVVLADFGENTSTLTTDQIRYMVVVFRSNVRSGNFTVGINCSKTNGAGSTGNYTGNLAVTTESNTYWTYAVLDLKNGSLGSNWSTRGTVYGVYVGLPIDASGEWMDIAHVAFFSDADQATAFGEYALTDGSDRGDNRAFGLLRSSRTQSGGTNYAGIVDNSNTNTVEQLNTYGDTTSIDFSTIDSLGYTLLGTFGDNGIANVGLLESTLSAEGYPVYKEEVVAYLAGLLKHSLEITERTSDGWKNYRYVKGTASSIYGGTDLATALRTKINGTTGSYAAASAKDLVGTWSEVSGNIASYYDAAYFLLNSIFVSGSYNEEQDDYDYLVLSAGTDSKSEDKIYVFDGGFSTSSTPSSASSAVQYDETNNTIQNTTAAGKAHFVYEGSNTTTLNPFLPVTDKNNEDGQTINPYYQDDGVINGIKKQTNKDTLYQRNYNFAMVSEGEFVYHEEDELFFEFEGDDDVYLFINGELVMDIGSAHSIDSVRFELNDYVNAAKAGTLGSNARNEALALEEGNTCSFKFYYMERHSYGSNIRICTNIKVTDPSMNTAKTAWQDGIKLDFGSVVDKDKVVEYGFAITNNGEENLYNLTFTDNDIGVTLDPTNGLTVTGERVYDTKGGTLEASDLTAVVSHPDYSDITVTFADNNALKAFLKTLASDAVLEAGGGLWSNSTVLIRGIGYKLSAEQAKAGKFDNTVFTTSTNKTESKKLQGQAAMRVYVPADPMYYQWAGHNLEVELEKLVEDISNAAAQEDNPLYDPDFALTTDSVDSIAEVTKIGTATDYNEVVYADGKLTINYPTAGSYVFYIKITYNKSANSIIVPVLVNVTSVQDSVYVLDYGLQVSLTESGELTKNDTLTVPGRSTTYELEGMTDSNQVSYTPNYIIFPDPTTELEGNYGTYTLKGDTLTYLPTAFLEGMDPIYLAMRVHETDFTPSNTISGKDIDINNEVEMYKTVFTLPANVVYYEDDFPAIKYKTDESGTGTTNTIERVGSSSGKTQSNDQSEQYGHDATYENTTVDETSAGTLTTITINKSGMVAYFTFKGTGFELIGRTNAYDSATLTVTVKQGDTVVKNIPVITEFDNGNNGGEEEIYQVPVIRVNGLEHGTYTVEISGVPARDYKNKDSEGNPTIIPTMLYLDGLRIYQPIADEDENGNNVEDEDEYYLDTEKDAEFIELRNQIAEGRVAAVTYSETDGLTVNTGTSTWTENLNKDDDTTSYLGNEVTSVDEYLLEGPNNEVYMNGTNGNSALVFYVTEAEGAKTHSLQIAVRGLDYGLFFAGAETGVEAPIEYGVYDAETDMFGWKRVVTCTSSTEQYYVIDYTQCYKDNNGRYQIVIRVDDGDASHALASFSSLKLTGLTLVKVEGNGEAADIRFTEGTLYEKVVSAEDAVEAASVDAAETETEATEAQETENTEATDSTEVTETEETTAEETEAVENITSDAETVWVEADASTYVLFNAVHRQMEATEVVNDEETEPEETVPEETTPEESVPEETEPEETEPEEPSIELSEALEYIRNRFKKISEMIDFLNNFWGKR